MVRLNQINIELIELDSIKENWSRVTISKLLKERQEIIDSINGRA